MAPNTNLEALERIVQIANPFDVSVYVNKLQGTLEEPSAVYYQGSSGQLEVADDEEDEPTLRITTRARFTYELERFNKNEMLFINSVNTHPSKTTFFKIAFQGYKFECTFIETAQKEKHEIWRNIDQFFQKDFSNVGIAAVVTLTSCSGRLRKLNRVGEWDVLNYYMANQPSSLQGKPKIFISETPEPSNLPHITSLPSDTLLIQAKAKKIVQNIYAHPLDLLCHKLISMEDTGRLLDLIDIISEMKHEASQAYPTHTSPVKYISTMTKELLLEKNIQYTDNWTLEEKYAVVSRLFGTHRLLKGLARDDSSDVHYETEPFLLRLFEER